MTGRPCVGVPDHRGRTGLDQAGRELDRNPDDPPTAIRRENAEELGVPLGELFRSTR